MKYKIQYVKKKLPQGWIGMNYFASKELGIPFKHKHPKHTLVIYDTLPIIKKNTIRHEEIEEYLMKNKHWHYHKAHALALKLEGYKNWKQKLRKKLEMRKK
jgi:hypothetical protein